MAVKRNTTGRIVGGRFVPWGATATRTTPPGAVAEVSIPADGMSPEIVDAQLQGEMTDEESVTRKRFKDVPHLDDLEANGITRLEAIPTSQDELTALKNIGAVKAQRILEYLRS